MGGDRLRVVFWELLSKFLRVQSFRISHCLTKPVFRLLIQSLLPLLKTLSFFKSLGRTITNDSGLCTPCTVSGWGACALPRAYGPAVESSRRKEWIVYNILLLFCLLHVSQRLWESVEKKHMGIMAHFLSWQFTSLVHPHLANGNNDSQYVPYIHNNASNCGPISHIFAPIWRAEMGNCKL